MKKYIPILLIATASLFAAGKAMATPFHYFFDTTLQSAAPFPFGAAVNVSLLQHNTAYATIVGREYNNLTPETAMKFATLHPAQNTYNFTDGDYLVNYAQQHGKRVHGHTLIWYNSLPAWVTSFQGDSAAWEGLMQTHIQTVMTHYRGQLRSWDVVNEAFNDDGTLRNSVWLQHLGPNFIARCFQYAHAADSSALLFYNDYGYEYSSAKLAAIVSLINTLQSNGIPIDGVGMQTHINTTTSYSGLSNAISTIAQTGLLVHISELDIAMNPSNNLSLTFTNTLSQQQADLYKYTARIYRTMVPPAQQYGMTTWDVTDADSWIPAYYSRPDWPLPFDSSYQKKRAWYELIDGLSGSLGFDQLQGQSVAGTYTDLGTSGTAITTNFNGTAMTFDNDNSSVQSIGFNFFYNGTRYTQFVLNTNGFIKLGVAPPSSNSLFYPTIGGNTGGVIQAPDIDLIYAFNHDLTTGTGIPEYRVCTSGTTGSRVCTIQFKNLADKLAPTQYTNLSFQVKLYEASNTIELVYGVWTASANTSTLATSAVGIKGVIATESVNVAKGSTVAWTTALSTANNYFFKNGDYSSAGPNFGNRNSLLPDAGRTYRFTIANPLLPVTLLSFSATPNNNEVLLQWSTANEVNNKNFIVQRSFNGNDFTIIATISAKSDDTNAITSYAYTDASIDPIPSIRYYRLQQTDKDGSTHYSSVIQINTSRSFLVTVVNPFRDVISLQVQSMQAAKSLITLMDMNGRILITQQPTLAAGANALQLNGLHLAAGVYLLKVTTSNNERVMKLVKQ